jgi:hypothetical protein
LNEINDLRQQMLNTQRKSSVSLSQEGKKIDVGVDLSNTNNIIDQVAWQSNFQVVIPNSKKRTIRAQRGQATVVKYNNTGTLLVSKRILIVENARCRT